MLLIFSVLFLNNCALLHSKYDFLQGNIMDEKSLSQRLTERALTSDAPIRKRNHAAFMAQKAEIAAALADGHRLKSIWELLRDEGKIEFDYVSMWRYVQRYLKPRKEKAAKPKAAKQPPNSGLTRAPDGRILPDWPKPGSYKPEVPKLDKETYRGEIPVYGKKTDPNDFNKF